MRRVHSGEGPVRLVGRSGKAPGPLTTEVKGRGELRRWREAGWLGRTKSTEIVIPDLNKKLQKWQGKGEPPAGEVVKAVQRVATSGVLFDGITLNLQSFTIPVLQRDGALTPARSPVDLEPQLRGFDGHP